MGDPVAVIAVLAGCAGYLVGYWRGYRHATRSLNERFASWIGEIKAHVEKGEALLVCMRRYVADLPALHFVSVEIDTPPKERMH